MLTEVSLVELLHSIIDQLSDNSGLSSSGDLGPFLGFKIGVPGGCLGESSTFKMIMIDDVTLWSKLESTW